MTVRRVVARAAAAAAVIAIPLSLGASPASGFEDYSQGTRIDHTFTATNGSLVDCTLYASSSLARFDREEAFTGVAGTEIFAPVGDQTGRCTGTASVSVVYLDGTGRSRSITASGFDTASVFVDETWGDLRATHRFTFANCSANCVVTAATSPK